MSESRRTFLKIAGGALIGGVPIASAIAGAVDGASSAKSPLAGRNWAMAIDIRKCMDKKGCNACQEACHPAHNVPKIGGVKEEVKWIWKERYPRVFSDQYSAYAPEDLRKSSVPVLCNHCSNPGCVRVCPTQATWKREDGVVMMDMHRCIGCRYCMAACPYGSRSFNWKDPRPFIGKTNPDYPTRSKGVVEKCNFCVERLDKGRMPLCVEACAGVGCNALVFGDLNDRDSELARVLRDKNAIRRKPELGNEPKVFYIV